MAGAFGACGKKGPPLAPFPRVPTKVENIAPARIGSQVLLSFAVPTANIDGRKPADLGALKVYGITTTRTPETPEEKKVATLLATLTVRSVLPELPPSAADDAKPFVDTRPGLDQGAQAVFSETLTDELRVPVELPKKKNAIEPPPVIVTEEPPPGPIVVPLEKETARRYYFVVAVSPRGREGPSSDVVSVPFGEPSSPPAMPTIDYNATQMTLKWDPPANAKTWTMVPVVPPPTPPPKPAAPVEEPVADPTQPPAPVVPPVPTTPPALTVKSLGFNTQATLYHVYEVPSASTTQPATLPQANVVTIPKPLTPQPIDKSEFIVRNVTFGVERCFFVRPIDVIFGMQVQGEASPQACVKPVDTFPPQAPRALAAIAGAGVINLIWDANAEPDLAGYIVLRGEAPGDRLLPLTPAPIRETTYRDTTVQTGVRYVYAVIAVDNANPPNQSAPSAKTEETARQ